MTTPMTARPGIGPWRASGDAAFPDAAMEGSIIDRFLEVAERFPDSTAISSPAGKWTYGELADRVRSAASAILDRLGEPSSAEPIGVLAVHDGPLVVAILSVLASGNTVVVMDPTVGSDANAHVAGESAARLIITDEANHAAASEVASGRPIDVALLEDLEATAVELPGRGPQDAAMLAFTSGTSGTPKAGVITHGVVLNVVRGATNALGVTPDDRMPMLFPTSLAVAAYPMFIPLLNGGTLATLDVRGVGLAPVADFLVDERITLAYMAPTVVRFLVDAVAGYEFPDLRMIALGGELVDAEVVELTHRLFGPELMANGFGTTETGVITLYVIDPTEELDGPVPSGYPVEDVELYILDEAGNPVPPGTSGEVAAASPYLFSGYRGHDDLSRLVLAPDPVGREGWSLYRTGDLGRLDEHGALVVLGRIDTKVKVRGRFVVLGDVESTLHELDGVLDAAVVATRRDGQVELRAVVVPSGDVDPAELRAGLLLDNEAYRVPAQWVFVDELPRLPNGKLDRRALLNEDERVAQDALSDAASGAVAEADTSDVAAAQPIDPAVERTLRDLWELLLPVGAVAPDDDFFHLGGDSLLAAQMLVMFEQQTGIRVPMGELVHARTLRDVARAAQAYSAGGKDTTVSCVQRGDETSRPRLWFVHDLQGSAFRIRHLAEALGADQPVWSFESPLLAGEPNQFGSLDVFAANYLTDLRRAQPEGPYYLAGYSFGGICAYEMARQLRRDGEEVAFVGVVDVGPGYRGPGWGDQWSPSRPWFGVQKPPPEGSSAADKFAYYRDMLSASAPSTARHLMVRSGVYRYVDPLRYRLDLRNHGRVRPEWRLWYSWDEHWKLAAKAWDRANRYDGRMDLFWASDTGSADNSLGWEPLVDDLRIHRFDGDHDSLLEPWCAPSLGARLRGVLDSVLDGRADREST